MIDAALWVFLALVLFVGLWSGSIMNHDDAIYADMARGAWEDGNWVDLKWHDATLYEKPPILFVIVSLFGGLLGFSDFVVRLPGALAGLGALYMVWLLGRELGLSKPGRRVAVLLLGTSFTFVFHCRRVMADPFFVLAMMGFLWAWIRLHQEDDERVQRRMMYVAGAFLGAAVLIKWVFAVLPLLAVLGWHMAMVHPLRMKKAFGVALVSFAVCAPWHILQSLRHGTEFWSTYAGYHVVERAQNSLIAPTSKTFYFQTLTEYDGILFAALIPAIVALAMLRGPRLQRGAAPWLMAFLAFAPLQLSQTRLDHYLLAVFPLVILGIAAGWEVLLERRTWAWTGPVMIAFLSLVLSLSPDLIAPNYSAPAKFACGNAAPGDTPVLVVNFYDVSATWHCGQPVALHTDDKRLFEVQQSIDMMKRSKSVHLHTPDDLNQLMALHPSAPIITRVGHGVSLLQRLGSDPSCVERCVGENQARAVSADMIQQECVRSCPGSGRRLVRFLPGRNHPGGEVLLPQ
jgi:4-amino-4-deoxy-L-arabinose transferase-like glycosyltransferase